MRIILCLVVLVAGAACKSEEKPADEGEPKQATPESDDPTEQPKAEPETKPLPRPSGKVSKVVRCNLSKHLGTEFMRSIYVHGKGSVYLFSDDMVARRFAPDKTGCGLAAAGTVEAPRYALDENGVVGEAPPDEETECVSRNIFLASWNGTYHDGSAYVVDDRVMYREKLSADGCKRAELTTENTQEGRPADLAVTDDHVLVLKFYASGNDQNSVWRFEHGGKLIDKIGLKEGGGTHIGWPDDVTSCGDGVCVSQSNGVVVFDAAGARLGSVKPAEIAGGEGITKLVDIFELPRRGVYALVELSSDDGRDIVRLDGMYQ